MGKDPWFEEIPKVELHIHLEGAIPHECMWELVKKYGGNKEVSSIQELKEKFVFSDFSHFINTWVWKNNFLREYDDFELISKEVADDMASQNIIYAEIFYSPPDFRKHGLDTQKLTQAIRRGLGKNPNIQIGLIPDLVRDFGGKSAAITLDEIKEVMDFGIVGIGLGGSEDEFPPKEFQNVFSTARNIGLRTTVHAGEASGPNSVWEAIKYLNPDRIGHGTRAIEDHDLVDYLLENDLPIEMCPISNIRTGIVENISNHPIKTFFKKGMMVTVNTDDPKMFGNSLAQEYYLLVEKLSFTKEDIKKIILNGVKASWMSNSKKQAMMKRFIEHPLW